jgi:hypothetical protein
MPASLLFSGFAMRRELPDSDASFPRFCGVVAVESTTGF